MKTKFKLIETEQDFRNAVGKSIVWIGDTNAGVSDTCKISISEGQFIFSGKRVFILTYLRGHSWVKEIYVLEIEEFLEEENPVVSEEILGEICENTSNCLFCCIRWNCSALNKKY